MADELDRVALMMGWQVTPAMVAKYLHDPMVHQLVSTVDALVKDDIEPDLFTLIQAEFDRVAARIAELERALGWIHVPPDLIPADLITQEPK